jgi:small subunit ribosomal protein S2
MVDPKDLISVGIQYGHQTKWGNPKMLLYTWGSKNKIHLINVSITAHQLEKAAKFLEQVSAEGKTVLWVGTKKVARIPVKDAAESVKSPYVTHRWIGGLLTNYSQVKKSLTKLLHLQDVLEKSDDYHYTKKEFNSIGKQVERLKSNVGGIVSFHWPVGAVVVVDVRKDAAAVREANALGIPVVALVDTNCDPSLVDYVIPGNDDAPAAIKLISDYLAQAIARGKERAKPVETADQQQGTEETRPAYGMLSEEEEANARQKRAKPTRPTRPVAGARTARPGAPRKPGRA